MCVCLCVCVCICQSTFRQRARPPLTRIPTNTHTHTHTLPCCCILAENGLQEGQAVWVRGVLHIVCKGRRSREDEVHEEDETGAGRLRLPRRGDPLGSLEPQEMGATSTRGIHHAAEYLSSLPNPPPFSLEPLQPIDTNPPLVLF